MESNYFNRGEAIMILKYHIEEMEGREFPANSFKKNILKPIFDVQKEYYFHPFMAISKAHVIMLIEQNIIQKDEGTKILNALLEIENMDFKSLEYDDSFEDMFFMIENMLENMVGKDIAGRMHIARSRNDIDLCEFRIVLREMLVEVLKAINDFREVLIELINDNLNTIMPAYTHTQPAQPSTLAHYLLAIYDALRRDFKRVLISMEDLNKNPLGAAAITTTGFKISRERTSELLGFNGLVENSYDSIAGVDYLTQTASSLMILNTNISKLLKDTLDFCTKEFNVYYLTDAYVQTSSIMPQKRNPSSLEQCRPLAGKAIGEAKVIFDVLYNTPYGDIVDSEEQLQPHIYDCIKYTLRILEVMKNVFGTLRVNKEILFERSHENFITATELADTLVREKNLSFRESHHIAREIVKYLIENNMNSDEISEKIIMDISQKVLSHSIELEQSTIKTALDPVNFVEIRDIIGGPSPKETRRMLNNRIAELALDKKTVVKWEDKFLNAYKNINKVISNL
jgi:argininosuccinate lyase